MGSQDLAAELLRLLEGAQNPDGGWGYFPDRESAVEPTCWASLAQQVGSLRPGAQAARAWLEKGQNPDGGWPGGSHAPESTWTTALALLALSHLEGTNPEALGEGYRWLLQCRSARASAGGLRLKPELEGWPWLPGTFGWVEPTAYGLLALSTIGPRDPDLESQRQERLRAGTELLYDRACPQGGWNYGNKVEDGTTTGPYVSSTAIALIALQHSRSHGANQKALAFLTTAAGTHPSGLGLSWSALCFDVYGVPPSSTLEHLERAYRTTQFLQNISVLGLASLALGMGRKKNFFRLRPQSSQL